MDSSEISRSRLPNDGMIVAGVTLVLPSLANRPEHNDPQRRGEKRPDDEAG